MRKVFVESREKPLSEYDKSVKSSPIPIASNVPTTGRNQSFGTMERSELHRKKGASTRVRCGAVKRSIRTEVVNALLAFTHVPFADDNSSQHARMIGKGL